MRTLSPRSLAPSDRNLRHHILIDGDVWSRAKSTFCVRGSTAPQNLLFTAGNAKETEEELSGQWSVVVSSSLFADRLLSLRDLRSLCDD
jgi:hypothetical protein